MHSNYLLLGSLKRQLYDFTENKKPPHFLKVLIIFFSPSKSNFYFFQAVEKVIKIGDKYPMERNVDDIKFCNCVVPDTNITSDLEFTPDYVANFTKTECQSVS